MGVNFQNTHQTYATQYQTDKKTKQKNPQIIQFKKWAKDWNKLNCFSK